MPTAQAAVLSIDDLSEGLSLFVNQPTTITRPGDFAPGGGNPIDITTSTPSNGISNIVYTLTGPAADPTRESLSFTFANQVNWGSDVYLYRYYTEAGSGLSDLFVIQGLRGTTPDDISFVSSDLLTGNISVDGPALLANSTATPADLGQAGETGDWQLAYDTGVDQYYIRSDVPEPATLTVLGAGLFGLGFVRRKRR